jgi:hypothetical protein
VFNRRCHAIEVDSSLCSQRVTRALAHTISQHGRPQRLQMDNGLEFRSRHLENWAIKEELNYRLLIRVNPIKTAASKVSTVDSGRNA